MKVAELLGLGGYGAVYRAVLPGGREYALKFIPYNTSLERALREFFILLPMRHRNLVRVSALGLWPEDKPEFLWLKMEFIEGERLDTWARACALTARTAARLTLEVCRGLAFAHKFKVVHRDVKEANILVRASSGEAVLIDFGLGTHEDALTLTSGPVPAGTAGYQAPELLRHAHAFDNQEVTDKYTSGPGDDLYALGVVLYRLLTGKAPVDGEDELAVINEAPLSVSVVNPVIPRELAGVCMRLLQKLPGSRYESAAVLCSVLEDLLSRAGPEWDVPLLGVAPTSAPPPLRSSTRRRNPLKARRRQLAVAAGIAATLAVGSWVSVAGLTGRHISVAPPEMAASPEVPIKSPALVTTRAGGKLASQIDSPDAGHIADSGTPETSAAIVAPSATTPTMATMTNTKVAPPVVTARKPNTAAAVLCTGALYLTIGCAGAPGTRPPEPRACPAGSWETMDGMYASEGSFPGTVLNRKPLDVLAISDGGEFALVMDDNQFGKFPYGTIFKGRFIFGTFEGEKAAYTLFTEATVPNGKPVAVCYCAVKRFTKEGGITATFDTIQPIKRFPDPAHCWMEPR